MAERPPIQVKTTALPSGSIVVAPEGDIGYHEAPTLRQAIKDAYERRPRRLLVDLAGVAYMATPGLATLVEALQISKKSGSVLVLCGLTERVRGVFEIARLQSVFKITADVASADTVA